MKKDWMQERAIRKGKLVPRHGWNSRHFFVKGVSVCQGWKSSIKGHNSFDNRIPRWKKIIGEDNWDNKERDCGKCTRIWLELFHMFRQFDKKKERLFP